MSERCHEAVRGEDWTSPCEGPAVGWRVDPNENQPYPVCVQHHRWPYADGWVLLRARVKEARTICDQWIKTTCDPSDQSEMTAVARIIALPIVAEISRALDGITWDPGGDGDGADQPRGIGCWPPLPERRRS